MAKRKTETEAIDRLYLELSQFTAAKTGRELRLESLVTQLLQGIERWAADDDGVHSAAWGAYREACREVGRQIITVEA